MTYRWPLIWKRSCARGALTAVIALLLTACANQDAFRRGEEQLNAHQWESALESLSQAAREDPANVQYRTTLSRARDQAVNELLVEASALREKQSAQAIEKYRRALLIAPGNERAIAGLESIDADQRHQRLFDDATRAASTGREQEARAKFKKLLEEVPGHIPARKALWAMDEKNGTPSTRTALDPALRKSVSLEFRDATLKMVFDSLASSTGINFVFDRDLKQDTRISVFLRNVAFDEAVEQIIGSNGLARKVVNPSTLLIYPATAQKLKEYQDLVGHNFFIANADVKQLSTLLKTVLKVKDIYTDEKRNVIVLRDTPEIIAMAEKLVAAHDQAEPEVMLEVEILEFNHTRDDLLGVKFPAQVAFGIASPITVNALRALNSTAINVTGLDSSLTLNLKRQLGDVHLLANPRIRVRNHEKAKFHIGDKVPVITSTTYPGSTINATSSSVSYLDVGIKLEFEPSIQLDDDVIIKTQLEVSNITNTVINSGTTAYQVGTRSAATTLTLRDGETQVLAGLLSTDESDTTDRLPGLGDVPVLGNLFSNRASKGGRKEILLSITPRILRNLQRPTEDLMEVNIGPEGGSQGGGGQRPASPTQPAMPTAQPAMPQPVSPSPNTPSGMTPMVPFGATPAPSPVPPMPTPTSAPTPGNPGVPPGDFEPPPGVGSTSGTGGK